MSKIKKNIQCRDCLNEIINDFNNTGLHMELWSTLHRFVVDTNIPHYRAEEYYEDFKKKSWEYGLRYNVALLPRTPLCCLSIKIRDKDLVDNYEECVEFIGSIKLLVEGIEKEIQESEIL